jgi:DNA-binding NarL/FixJ family response regulator
MVQACRLLIVHDNYLHCQCLAAALANTGHFEAIQSAANSTDALMRVRQDLPNVVLADWNLPCRGALDLSRQVTQNFPEVKVLLLGFTETAETVQECAEAGVAGYVLKEDTIEQLSLRIAQVMRGETVCSAGVTRHLFSHLAQLAGERWCDLELASSPLTRREMQILQLIADGMSNKQIAKELSLSLHTVKNHVHNLLEKLSARGRSAAVKYALEKQWLQR